MALTQNEVTLGNAVMNSEGELILSTWDSM